MDLAGYFVDFAWLSLARLGFGDGRRRPLARCGVLLSIEKSEVDLD